MSLKAKIEAVLYASEEPVTPAQLVSLLGEEAQAELDALAAQQESLPLEEPAEPETLNAEVLGEAVESAAAERQIGKLNVAEESETAPSAESAEVPPESPAHGMTLEEAEADAKAGAAAARARERRLRV